MVRSAARLLRHLPAALTAACLVHGIGIAATLPTAPRTFNTTYAAPTGAKLTVGAGDNLQAALDKAQLGDTIELEAGAKFTGPFTLPNKTGGSGWVYVVSSDLSHLPPPGTRVTPANAASMPKILAPNALNALRTVANSHHFRFVGIEFGPAPGVTRIYALIAIGSAEKSPAALPNNIVFDRCYVHGDPTTNNRRGIAMDGAFVAVVDSYISDFQEVGTDSQGLWAYNTTGPLQIRNNYIEGAAENVLFGGADAASAELVPADIEIRDNYFFKPLSLLKTKNNVKNLLEFKEAKRVAVTGNVFQNNPLSAQQGFAILVTPRNSGHAPWTVTSDIKFEHNTLINVGSGVNISGRDDHYPSELTERILIRDNVFGVTGLNNADGRTFQTINGGNDYTIDHNTIINTASGRPSDVMMADTAKNKVNNFTFTNNVATQTAYGFFGAGAGQGTAALNAHYTNWVFSKNAIVNAPAASYPSGNFFPSAVANVRFLNYNGGNFALSADSPYKGAGTDGKDLGADFAAIPSAAAIAPNAPSNVAVQ